MMSLFKLENSTGKDMQLCIEPQAEYIDWGLGKVIEIELKLVNERYNDGLNLTFTELALVIYECRQYEMKIFVDKHL